MIESLTLFATAALLFVFATAGYVGGGEALLAAAALTIACGFAFGVTTGSIYHGILYRVLAREGRVRRHWWLHPAKHHGLIPTEKRRRVMMWFHAGAAGFFITLAGCALLLLWIVLY